MKYLIEIGHNLDPKPQKLRGEWADQRVVVMSGLMLNDATKPDGIDRFRILAVVLINFLSQVKIIKNLGRFWRVEVDLGS